MIPDPARGIPILPSFDIAETLDFYCRHLGFAGEAYGDDARVNRDAMELHFRLTRDRSQNTPRRMFRDSPPSR